jgi:hypothetical protein
MGRGEIEALALKALALNEMGATEAARTLLAYDRLVTASHQKAPLGYADLATFNRALAGHIAAHPTLKVPPADHPTYHNPQLKITEEILTGRGGTRPLAFLARYSGFRLSPFMMSISTH